MTDKPLNGLCALVTGGSSGIGAGIARALGGAGAQVSVNYRSDEEGARAVCRDLTDAGGRAVIVQGDVSKPEDCARMFDQTQTALGPVDILAANAGIQKDAPFAEMSLEDWRAVIDVNLNGQFICAQEAVRRFRKKAATTSDGDAGERAPFRARGVILFTSSVHQEIPWAGRVNYAAAKGGLKLMMESMAQELSSEGIRVNAIAPGAIKTPINAEAWQDDDAREQLLKLIPYGRLGLPEDIGEAAVWLASDRADYVIGTTLYVDGGMLLYPSFRGNG